MAYHADIFHGTYATLQENSCWIYEAKGNKALIDKTGRTCWRRISWVVVLRMYEELLVVVQRFCWTYNKFDFDKVNDNGSLVGIYRSHYNPRDSQETSLPCFLICEEVILILLKL